jgi:hypothetical protein
MVLLNKRIGSESFIEKIIDEHPGYKKNNRDIPALKKLKKIHDINLVYEVAISIFLELKAER